MVLGLPCAPPAITGLTGNGNQRLYQNKLKASIEVMQFKGVDVTHRDTTFVPIKRLIEAELIGVWTMSFGNGINSRGADQ